MTHVIHTQRLLREGVLTPSQADEIIRRSRDTMMALVVNVVLCAGILSAAFGLIFWLADALSVAVAGGIFLVLGLAVLVRGGVLYRMIGHAAALIGAGLWIAGAGIEIAQQLEDQSGPILLMLGGLISAVSAWAFQKGPQDLRFVSGSVFLMGAGLHIAGLYITADVQDVLGVPLALVHLYTALIVAGSGLWLNVRFITALAIVPFAQMLSTGTAYFHAAYAFYSPETTFTILQMAMLAVACLFVVSHQSDRIARHAGILAVMAIVVLNLAFLVGSLWGDYPGETFLWSGSKPNDTSWTDYYASKKEWQETAFFISEGVYSVVWAIGLLVAAVWAAHGAKRGVFNATVTFAGIHAYTQLFESLESTPLAFAILGLTAVPAAWALWRWNEHVARRSVEVA